MTAYELESKVELSQPDFEKLLAYGKVCGLADQLNIYYDCNHGLSKCSATFRVRLSKRKKPVMTLKLPLLTESGIRKSIEVEQILEGKATNYLQKQWDVANDLPEEFATHLLQFGINRLDRVGWMRNRRWQVEIMENLIIELDQVSLPNGRTFFEAEIESSHVEMHSVALSIIHKVARSPRPSTISKYDRFLQALEEVI